jgi:adenylate kinase family enzyme
MKIHIMGASCAGSTTLGRALSTHLNIHYFDTDVYFWAPSDIPYTIKREPAQRNQMLKDDIALHEDFIIGGSLINWGEEWKGLFDLIVFLYLDPKIRLQRLVAREVERYGNVIYTDPERNLLHKEFIEWASKYDDRTFTGRNIKQHEEWFANATAEILEIRGDTTVQQRIDLVTEKISHEFNRL